MPKINLKITFAKFSEEINKADALMDASEAASFLRGIIDAKDTVLPSEYLTYILGDERNLPEGFTDKQLKNFFAVLFSVQNQFSKAATQHRKLDFRQKSYGADFESLKIKCKDLRSEIRGYKTALALGNTDPNEFLELGEDGMAGYIAFKDLDNSDSDLKSHIEFEKENNRLPTSSEFQEIKEVTDLIKQALDEGYSKISEASRKLRARALGRDKLITEVTDISIGQNERKIGRNDPCTCGSGKKYKHCCLNRNN